MSRSDDQCLGHDLGSEAMDQVVAHATCVQVFTKLGCTPARAKEFRVSAARATQSSSGRKGN